MYVIGISGGKDSAALAIYLKQKYPKFYFSGKNALNLSCFVRLFRWKYVSLHFIMDITSITTSDKGIHRIPIGSEQL